MSHNWYLPMSRLLVICADCCLVVMTDTHLVRRTAHLQTGILGSIWAYRGGARTSLSRWNHAEHENQQNIVLKLKDDAAKHQAVPLVFQPVDSYILPE